MFIMCRRYRLVKLAMVFFAISAFIGSPVAYAGYSVTSPHVKYGETKIEAKTSYNHDERAAIDGTGAFKVEVGYGFTDYWKSEISIVKLDRAGNGTTDIKGVEWENKFQFTSQAESGIDFGLKAEVEYATEDGHASEFKLGPLLQKTVGPVDFNLAVYLKREVGSHAARGTELSYAARVRYRAGSYFAPAIEVYGSPGDVDDFLPAQQQRLQAGPAVYGGIPVGSQGHEIEYSVAALRGLTDIGSPGWVFVLRIEYGF